jgi:hypothetical protein
MDRGAHFNQEEKEALKREVLEELRKDALKKEIISELKPAVMKYSVWQYAQNPVSLLLLGFVLTGVLGAGLTSYWKNKEWDYQQKRLAQIHSAEQKIKHKNEIRDDVRKQVDDTLNADLSVLNLILSEGGAQNRNHDLSDDRAHWEQITETWQVNYHRILQNVSTVFNDPEAKKTFQEIMSKKKVIKINIASVLAGMEQNNWKIDTETYKNVRTIMVLATDTREELARLLEIMAREIQTEDHGDEPAG